MSVFDLEAAQRADTDLFPLRFVAVLTLTVVLESLTSSRNSSRTTWHESLKMSAISWLTKAIIHAMASHEAFRVKG
jgi:hypothetical protein